MLEHQQPVESQVKRGMLILAKADDLHILHADGLAGWWHLACRSCEHALVRACKRAFFDGKVTEDLKLPTDAVSASRPATQAALFQTPAIGVRQTGYAPVIGEEDVVAVGPNNSLMYYHAKPNEDWSAPQIQGPATGFTPAIVVRPTAQADVVATGNDNSCCTIGPFQPGNGPRTRLPQLDHLTKSIGILSFDDSKPALRARHAGFGAFPRFVGFSYLRNGSRIECHREWQIQ